MKLTKKRKDAIENHLKNISQMGRLELGAFDMRLQEQKHDMDAIVWKWVNKGVVKQMAHLNDVDKKNGWRNGHYVRNRRGRLGTKIRIF